MGEVVSYPVVCPYCDKIMDKYDWKKISEGYEQSTGSNYSMSKGIVGGLLGLGTHMGFAHSKGDSKGKRLDNYQCRHCKAMIQIEVHTFW